ncbi:MAG: hypothetical protein OEV43_05375 [Coriobacteriia bacterium]|nr:hypothetical protein [Coriobacteriia bacterium]
MSSDLAAPSPPAKGSERGTTFGKLPGSAIAWWAVALTVLIFPVAYVLMAHLLDWPIFDTAFAPVLLMTLIDAAAVLSLVAFVRGHERSWLLVFALAVSGPLALFATMMMIGEVVAPH